MHGTQVVPDIKLWPTFSLGTSIQQANFPSLSRKVKQICRIRSFHHCHLRIKLSVIQSTTMKDPKLATSGMKRRTSSHYLHFASVCPTPPKIGRASCRER